MEPWMSWSVVVVGGGAAWYYYSHRNSASTRRNRSLSSKELRKQQEKQRKEAGQSGSDSQYNSAAGQSSGSNSKAKKKQPKAKRKLEPSNLSTSHTSPQLEGDDKANEDEADNEEFARELTEAKKGTLLSKAGSSKQSKKSKTAKISESSNLLSASDNTEASAASSTTGADADDDLSPAISPALKATGDKAAESGDVSDMLEQSASGPSILRLTQPENPVPQRSKPQPKVFEKAETKKQRQNRKKNEVKKLAKEEDEKERKVLLENQRRTVREAEGRPMKNGLAPSKPPAVSAWTNSSAPTNGNGPAHAPGSKGVVLLDTFEKVDEPSQSSAKVIGKSWEKDLPSEEEQIRMLAESDESGWNTVSKKGKKKGTPNNGEAASTTKETSGTGTAFDALAAKDSFDGGEAFETHGNSDWAA
ncbi:MAG: hypothetical protein M1814_006308 [Vezdaea aestivalis]|nr:MAG: hypothetical protein M1814_006308 [Vezdaea aestivalis]